MAAPVQNILDTTSYVRKLNAVKLTHTEYTASQTLKSKPNTYFSYLFLIDGLRTVGEDKKENPVAK
jgi:hypothetical protein